jgi:hypothetical protein
LEKDAKEEKNLWDDLDCQEMKQEMLDAMRKWLIESNLKTGQWQEGWR